MTIRPYKNTDRDAVHDACLYCDGPENYSEGTKNFLFATYCDYYIEKEPFNCFVAADDNDRAVGYIICAEDFDSFIKTFREEYFTRIPEDDTACRYYAAASTEVPERYKEVYPAHLHIDILHGFHRMGLGKKLMDALISHLKEKGVRGVVLGVNVKNEQGVNFYKKYGFELLGEDPDTLAFGMKLQEKKS
ncbi:MAG: GNAT family N-acetyltransferase [Clostridia bacterium]|nr:GNAT family N-acetyltransferase [Clostridia bacterium]